MKKVFLYLLLIVLLGCRNEEMLIEQVSNSEKGKIEFFENYENNKIVNYPYSWFNYKVITPNTPFHQSFKILLHNVPNLKNHIENNYGRIEWDITTEVIENEIGDKFVYYPIVNKDDEVDFMAKVVVSKDNDAFGLEIQNRKSEEIRRLFDKTDELNVDKLQVLRRCNVNGICYLPGVEIIKPRPIVPRYPRFSVEPYNPPHYDIGDGGGLFVPIECMSVRGCGDGNVLPPVEEIIFVCYKIKNIGKHSKTIQLMKNLKKLTKDNKEHGYILEMLPNSIINYYYVEGEIDRAGIDFYVEGQIDGFIHTHYTGLLSVFSPYDIFSLTQFYKQGNIKNVNNFIMGVVSDSDTQYIMIIEDTIKFNNFANNLFKGDTFDEITLSMYEIIYKTVYGIDENNSVLENEIAFVKFLDAVNSGIKVLKSDSNMDNWKILELDDKGKLKDKNCN